MSLPRLGLTHISGLPTVTFCVVRSPASGHAWLVSVWRRAALWRGTWSQGLPNKSTFIHVYLQITQTSLQSFVNRYVAWWMGGKQKQYDGKHTQMISNTSHVVRCTVTGLPVGTSKHFRHLILLFRVHQQPEYVRPCQCVLQRYRSMCGPVNVCCSCAAGRTERRTSYCKPSKLRGMSQVRPRWVTVFCDVMPLESTDTASDPE
jgi:hypothetical protein